MTSTDLESDLREMFELQTRTLGLGSPPELRDTNPRLTHLPERDRRGWVLAIAAAAVLFVGGGALWWTMDVRGGSTPADQPKLEPEEAPLLVLDAAEWEMTSFTETDTGLGPEGQITFVDPVQGVSGPRISVHVNDAGSVAFDVDQQAVKVGTSDARLYVNGDETLLHWTEPGGHTLEAFGWNVSEEYLLAVAAQMTVGDDGLPVAASLPVPLVALTGRDAELVRMLVEYQWVDAHGRGLQLTLYPGGETTYDDRVEFCCESGDETRNVNFQGTAAHVVRSSNLTRLDQLRGFWVWEITGHAEPVVDGANITEGTTNFASIDDFLSVAERIVPAADPATWRASLHPDFVLRAEIPAVVAELAQFPMPPGVAAPTVVDEGFTQRRSGLAQAIAIDTACAWADALTIAVNDHDIDTVLRAVGVIIDVANWDETAGIPDTIVGTDVLTPAGSITEVANLLQPFAHADEVDDETIADVPTNEIASTLRCDEP